MTEPTPERNKSLERLSLLQSQLSAFKSSKKVASIVDRVKELLGPLYPKGAKTNQEEGETPPNSHEVLKHFFQRKNKYDISTSEMVDILSKNQATSVIVNHIYNFMNEDIGINDSWLIYEIGEVMTKLNEKKKSIFYIDIIKKCQSIKNTGLQIIKADTLERYNETLEDWFSNIKHFFGGFISSSGDSFLADETLVLFFESMIKYVKKDLMEYKIVNEFI